MRVEVLAILEEPVNVVYEDNYVCCFLDHAPYNEGYVILPKNHIRYFHELDENSAVSIMKSVKILTKVIKELFNPDGITVCQNGGNFDGLTHFHMHIVTRNCRCGQSYLVLQYTEFQSDIVMEK